MYMESSMILQISKMHMVLGNILTYQAIINRIPNDWKNRINSNKQLCREFKYGII